ncbi:MAG TPA: type II secretion system protein [Planctomycetota bacterium]|nr:type II secretion system protein [Planctomycetota bacterium]
MRTLANQVPPAVRDQRSKRANRRCQAGFTLIELIVAVTILAILAGAAIPVTAKVLTYKARKATQEEQTQILDAAANFFADTGSLPLSVANLLVAPQGVAGWTGPYLPGISTDQLSGLTTYQVDGWSRPYRVTVAGDTWTLESAGEDGTFGTPVDLQSVLDVTYLRREWTIDRLRTVNQAITLYNAALQATSPLSTNWSTAFSQLVGAGYLPNVASLSMDGWGDGWVPDPVGVSPVVRVRSVHLSTPAQVGSGTSGAQSTNGSGSSTNGSGGRSSRSGNGSGGGNSRSGNGSGGGSRNSNGSRNSGGNSRNRNRRG